jgi:hypothetical protein
VKYRFENLNRSWAVVLQKRKFWISKSGNPSNLRSFAWKQQPGNLVWGTAKIFEERLSSGVGLRLARCEAFETGHTASYFFCGRLLSLSDGKLPQVPGLKAHLVKVRDNGTDIRRQDTPSLDQGQAFFAWLVVVSSTDSLLLFCQSSTNS